MTMKLNILLFAAVVLHPAAESYGQVRYNLPDCIAAGLENNYSIIVARNKESISDNNYTRGNAGYLPAIDFSGRYGGTVTSTTQNLAAGGENSSYGIHNTSATAGVSLGWSIFRGFSVQTTYRKLAELKEIGELNTQLAIENLVARIVAEYDYLIQQKRLYNNLEFAVSLSRERVRIDEERYLLGSGSKLQLLQSRVYFNSDSSRLARQNEVLRSSEIRLNELMSVEDLGQYLLIADTILPIEQGLTFEMLLDETLENNTALQIARRNRTVSQYDYKIISSRSYPYVSFSSGYSSTLNMYETGTYSSQFSRGASYGLSVGVNMFDGLIQRNDRRNALIELENKDLQYLQVEQEVKADLITIHSAYINNLRLLKLEEENLATARENLEIAFERYLLGNLSGLDLREVQKSLLDAEERLLSVQYQTKTAEISLYQISGRIMEYMR
jgi:outer membrane protein TolC